MSKPSLKDTHTCLVLLIASPVQLVLLIAIYSACLCVWMNAKLLQSYPTLYDSTDYSSPGSSAHGILQARILGWAAMPSSRGSFWPRDQTQVSCIASRFLPTEPPQNEYHNIFYEKWHHKYCFMSSTFFSHYQTDGIISQKRLFQTTHFSQKSVDFFKIFWKEI